MDYGKDTIPETEWSKKETILILACLSILAGLFQRGVNHSCVHRRTSSLTSFVSAQPIASMVCDMALLPHF
jgi:hypothetical protein